MLETIGRFSIIGKLDQGGMGVVYVGHDSLLDRRAAIKLLLDETDPASLQRFLLEARAAASVSHPNICQIYEVGEDGGRMFIAMELLEGEGLHARLARGPLPPGEALEVALGILRGLEEIHRRGFVHRDLKPSNVQVTPHGIKILDFGLARAISADPAQTDLQLTKPGAAMGTPQYMAPEQWAGEPAGPAADLFAVGAILYEMMSGRPAFAGETIYEICDAVTRREPPALHGGPEAIAVDRVIQRALEKRPGDRFPSAGAMAESVQATRAGLASGEVAGIKPATRFIALPFRVLRADPETDFLAFSLPDAVAGSLSRLESLVVRSTLASRRFDAESFDLKALAREVEVDLVLTGSLLRAGNQIRVQAHLTEAASGTIVWSRTSQFPLGDLFALQDSLAHEIVDSLALPLSSRERRQLGQDAPAAPRAYELYLRANQVSLSNVYGSPLTQVRDMYRQCLAEDPRFAPAWARLGRVHRMIAKYGHDDPEANYRLAAEAFARALEIDPELSIAHHFVTYLELEDGRVLEALRRLLARVHHRVADPALFAALVPACRFAGLLGPSLAAERRAHRLDPVGRTSVHYTYFMLGDYERTITADNDDPRFLAALTPALLGRVEESLACYREFERRGFEGAEAAHTRMVRAALEGDRAACLAGYAEFLASGFRDPEGIYFMGRNLARLGLLEEAIACLTRVVHGGFWCVEAAAPDAWLDSLRNDPRFLDLLRRAEEGRKEAIAVYLEAGGERVLGPASAHPE